jgi:four helix bundle protein
MPQLQPYHERGFAFACSVVRLYVLLIKTPDMPWHIARQVLKAGTSVGANLEEARGAQTRRDLASKFSIALKEAHESQYWLRLIQATGLATAELIAPVLAEATELVAILTVTRRKLNRDG